MEIKDLATQKNFEDINAHVSWVGNLPDEGKFYQQIELDDGTGRMRTTIWNDAVGMFTVGDTVHIDKGYVKSYEGKKGTILSMATSKTQKPLEKTGHDAEYRPNNLSPRVEAVSTQSSLKAITGASQSATKPTKEQLGVELNGLLAHVDMLEKAYLATAEMPMDWGLDNKMLIALKFLELMF